MKEVKRILRILKESKKSIEEGDSRELKVLSNEAIKEAATSQDADNIIVAVLIYSIGKVLERKHYQEMEAGIFFIKIL